MNCSRGTGRQTKQRDSKSEQGSAKLENRQTHNSPVSFSFSREIPILPEEYAYQLLSTCF